MNFAEIECFLVEFERDHAVTDVPTAEQWELMAKGFHIRGAEAVLHLKPSASVHDELELTKPPVKIRWCDEIYSFVISAEAYAKQLSKRLGSAIMPMLNSPVPLDSWSHEPSQHWWRIVEQHLKRSGFECELFCGELIAADELFDVRVQWQQAASRVHIQMDIDPIEVQRWNTLLGARVERALRKRHAREQQPEAME